jgi:Leucine-rich repeat (LRR) protein
LTVHIVAVLTCFSFFFAAAEMVRSRIIRNTLDPNWCEMYTVDIDRRIEMSKCTMRFEVWDWDYGGDDADDLLGQVTFEGIEKQRQRKEEEQKEVETEAAATTVNVNEGKKDEEKTKEMSLQDLLEAGRDGKTMEDMLQEVTNVSNQEEDEQRVQKMLGEDLNSSTNATTPTTSTTPATPATTTTSGEGIDDERNVDRPGPSFLQDYKLCELPKKKKNKSSGSPVKSTRQKSIRIKGTLLVGARLEPSAASKKAAKMAQREQAASSSAFELWPQLFVANMSHNRLMQLPRGVRGWKGLRRLHLGGNTLSVLPNEFCLCCNLENLNLADNQLVSLPKDFGHLSKLMNLRLDRNKLTSMPVSAYTITTLQQLHLADNPLKPIDSVKLWHHGDPILRFKDTAAKLLEVEPTAVRRMEPGTRIFDTTLYTRRIRTDGGPDERKQGPQAEHVRFDSILCQDFFSVTGCRYGAYCMFSHIPEPLPVVPFQRDKESMAKEDVRMKMTSHDKKPVHFYGITHDEYDELWKILEEDSADDERSSGSSDDEYD